jgi:hypothetical protein
MGLPTAREMTFGDGSHWTERRALRFAMDFMRAAEEH